MFEYFYVTFYKYYVIYRLIRNNIKYIVLNDSLCLLPSQVYLHSNEIIYYPFIECKQTCLIHYVFSCRHLVWSGNKTSRFWFVCIYHCRTIYRLFMYLWPPHDFDLWPHSQNYMLSSYGFVSEQQLFVYWFRLWNHFLVWQWVIMWQWVKHIPGLYMILTSGLKVKIISWKSFISDPHHYSLLM